MPEQSAAPALENMSVFTGMFSRRKTVTLYSRGVSQAWRTGVRTKSLDHCFVHRPLRDFSAVNSCYALHPRCWKSTL